MNTKFRELQIGDTFDFIDDNAIGWNSFYDRCIKTSARTYRALNTQHRFHVSSINATVFHVKFKWLELKLK